jgi:hypothetical protein
VKFVLLFEMEHKYVERHSVQLKGAFGSDATNWMLLEGAIIGERIRGRHKALNLSAVRADGVATPDARGVIITEDGAEVLYEISGLAEQIEGQRHVKGSMIFRTGAQQYAWLNTVLAVLSGRYARNDSGETVGRFQVYECVMGEEA